MNLSIIIPVYNSSLILPKLIKSIHKNTNKKKLKKEIILINDSSKDDSWKTILKLKKKYNFIKGINLKKNYGQHNAIISGLNFSKGNIVVLMDDDMQHHPKYIIKIYNELINGNSDVCYVKYLKRKHLKWKIFVSWLNNIIASFLALKSITIYTSSFKGINKKIISKMIKYKKNEVFLDWLILKQTNKISVINILHKKRFSGKTNYNLKKLLELWSIMIMNIEPKTIFHNLYLLLPKIFVKLFVYPFVKKNNINEQYKILNKTF
jgi:polyisoprenyl-phosphate glycosyltransferase